MGITEETGLLLLDEVKKLNAAIKKFSPNTHKKVWVGVKELKMFAVWQDKEDIRQARSKGYVFYKQDRVGVTSYLYDLTSIAPVFLLPKDKQA